MKELLLIFSSTVLILLISLFFGFKQLKNDYQVSSEVRELATPLGLDLDIDFIRKKSF